MTKQRGFACIGLDNPKDACNVGSALRAAGVYQASLVAVSGKRYRHSSVDTMKAFRHVPMIHADDLFTAIPYDCTPVAVDLIEGARSLPGYTHPERAFYIFGAEDATLADRITSRCRDVIYVPTNGCMNLAASINVVLYDRLAKQLARKALI